MHAGGMSLHRVSHHECTFGLEREGIDLVGQAEKFFRLQVKLLYIPEICDFGKAGLERRTLAQLLCIAFNVSSGHRLSEPDRDQLLLRIHAKLRRPASFVPWQSLLMRQRHTSVLRSSSVGNIGAGKLSFRLFWPTG